jgi:TATA-box binding protein (TBP) (component of TFIID and TFIIIB)
MSTLIQIPSGSYVRADRIESIFVYPVELPGCVKIIFFSGESLIVKCKSSEDSIRISDKIAELVRSALDNQFRFNPYT